MLCSLFGDGKDPQLQFCREKAILLAVISCKEVSANEKYDLKLKGNKRPWHTGLRLSTPVPFFIALCAHAL